MSHAEETSCTSTFGSERVHRIACGIKSSWMIDVIATSSEGLLCGRVNHIDNEWNVDADVWVQAPWWSPCTVSHTAHEFARGLRGLHWHTNPVHCNAVICGMKTCDFDLQAFERGVHVAGSSTGARFFAQHVPWFQGLSQFDVCTAGLKGSHQGTAEFKMSAEPTGFHVDPGGIEKLHHRVQVLPQIVREHEAVMNQSAPSDEWIAERFFPESGYECANEQLLSETHAGMRRHFKSAEFEETESSGSMVW